MKSEDYYVRVKSLTQFGLSKIARDCFGLAFIKKANYQTGFDEVVEEFRRFLLGEISYETFFEVIHFPMVKQPTLVDFIESFAMVMS